MIQPPNIAGFGNISGYSKNNLAQETRTFDQLSIFHNSENFRHQVMTRLFRFSYKECPQPCIMMLEQQHEIVKIKRFIQTYGIHLMFGLCDLVLVGNDVKNLIISCTQALSAG
jgi:hypothetical protein